MNCQQIHIKDSSFHKFDDRFTYILGHANIVSYAIAVRDNWIRKILYLVIFMIFSSLSAIHGQDLIQNIKGQILDKDNQQGLPGVIIQVQGSNPQQITTSDEKGYFVLKGVKTGRITLVISFVGYKTVVLENQYIGTGKELALHIEMEEKVNEIEKVTITAQKGKADPNNDMAMISARSFTVEETEKYAGSRGDVARMAENYAGVSYANDSRNDA